MPHNGHDAVVAASAIVMALQPMVSRETDPNSATQDPRYADVPDQYVPRTEALLCVKDGPCVSVIRTHKRPSHRVIFLQSGRQGVALQQYGG